MEKKKLTLTEKAQFMEERDDNKNFYDQFDRESILYHEGCETQVPLGGKNLPQSMPAMYPEGFDPNAPPPKDYSADDVRCQEIKVAIASFRDFKKKWTKVADSFVSRKLQIAKKGKEGEVRLMSKKIRTQINDLKAWEEEQRQSELFVGYEEQQEKVVAFINEMAPKKDLKLVDDLKVVVKELTRLIFKRQNECMTLLKERKKELIALNEGVEETGETKEGAMDVEGEAAQE